MVVQQQVHGYRQGHELLSASVVLGERDQDVVNRLSDLTGSLRPGQRFDPYISAYPLPSGKYYVVARTFQDRLAVRSGCVRTNSALIPMVGWETLESLNDLLEGLVCPDATTVASEWELGCTGRGGPAAVGEGPMLDLVDAVFRDERPVVFFDCAQPEAVAVRLMLALWPAARRRLAVCTFALAPRRLEERFFDVVFAPKDSRSVFAGPGYRRVGGETRDWVGSEVVERRWAGRAASRIFGSGDPRLTAWDKLGLLGSEGQGDLTSLRVVALWNELAARAEGSPTAVLGMLDILRSRKALGGRERWGDLEATVVRAIGDAAEGVSVRESWEFLFALEGKISGGWASTGVQRAIEAGAVRLAGRDVGEAWAALGADPSRRLGSKHVLKGLADGVGQAGAGTALVEEVGRVPGVVLARAMAASALFARRVVEGLNGEDAGWWAVVWEVFEAGNEVAKRAIRRAAVEVLRDGLVEPTIPRMLRGVGCEEMAELARAATERVSSASRCLNGALWDAARVGGCETVVREAVMEVKEDGVAEGFVGPTLGLNRRDVEWLAGRRRDRARARRLLVGLLETVGDGEIKALSRAVAVKILGLLGSEVDVCQREIARVLTLDIARHRAAYELGWETLAVLRDEESRLALGGWVARAGLRSAGAGDERLARALAEFGCTLSAVELVEAATSGSSSGERVGANLIALEQAEERVRGMAVGAMGRLSDRLVCRPREDLGAEAYRAWASLIRDFVAESEEDVAARVCRSVLRHAMGLGEVAVSALVVETFPVAYRSLPKGGKPRSVGGVGALLSPYYLWWLGLNEVEDSRRRAVRELVEAFMDSAWPAGDLMVTALRARVARKVVKRIRKRAGGEEYIRNIEGDVVRLGERMGARVLRCLEVAP